MAKLQVASVQIIDIQEVPRAGATSIAELLRNGIAARGNASVALAGGNTPRRIYEELAKLPVEWDRVHFYFGDERCVPADDPSSNFRMAREALFESRAGPRTSIGCRGSARTASRPRRLRGQPSGCPRRRRSRPGRGRPHRVALSRHGLVASHRPQGPRRDRRAEAAADQDEHHSRCHLGCRRAPDPRDR